MTIGYDSAWNESHELNWSFRRNQKKNLLVRLTMVGRLADGAFISAADSLGSGTPRAAWLDDAPFLFVSSLRPAWPRKGCISI
jgi:hypothetical protein